MGRAEALVARSFYRAPADFNLWEEEEAQPLHLLRSNLIMDCRFRRSGSGIDHRDLIAEREHKIIKKSARTQYARAKIYAKS